MTAEILVMNKLAVALAADSAVTIEIASHQGRQHKIYNTTNKLFMLSKHHPVGIMVYGNAELLRVPWEILIKNYRRHLGNRSFSTVQDYGMDFIAYLGGFFSEADQNRHFYVGVTGYYQQMILQQIHDAVEEVTRQDGGITIKQIKKIMNRIIDSEHKSMLSKDRLESSNDDFENHMLEAYGNILDEAIGQTFEKLPLSKNDRQKLRKIGVMVWSRDVFPDDFSGVVIAGFGENENFPNAYAIAIDGVINSRLKYRVTHHQQTTVEQPATIIPFAQQEMVFTFIEGIDPRYDDLLLGYLTQLFDTYPGAIVDSIQNMSGAEKSHLHQELTKQAARMRDELVQRLTEYRRGTFVDPVMTIVSLLPKDELAAMAESLVNLTSFKRRVSTDAETVGGPIDVAVISKGDGFVWIKRKHYFDSSLNHHFFAHYYASTTQEDRS